MKKVMLLGATGMLGRGVSQVLESQEITLVKASRTEGLLFDAERDSISSVLDRGRLLAGDYVINCIGITKGRIKRDDQGSVMRAIRLNSLFPGLLDVAAGERGLRVIQVATDCVFSGRTGGYSELSEHDAYDLYGKSKTLGEVQSENFMHLRCSLIGPEGSGRNSLFFEWVRRLGPSEEVQGFTNHMWNGLTSQAFARVVAGIVKSDSFSPGVQHLVPKDTISKYDLIRLELELLGRADVTVEGHVTESSVDRTLDTTDSGANSSLFRAAGYETIPTIREMMEELPWEELRGK